MNSNCPNLFTDYTENQRFELLISLNDFWLEFFEEQADSLWTEFWRTEFEGSHSYNATKWFQNAD